MDAQSQQPARHAAVGWIQRHGKLARPGQVEQPPERQDLRTCRYHARKPIVQDHRLAGSKTPLLDVEANMPPSVRKQAMLAGRATRDRQPRRKPGGLDRIGMTTIGRHRRDADHAGIEIGMPDDPSIRGRKLRILGESATPNKQPRRPSPRLRASPCSPSCARRHSRHRAAAIPTSGRYDRCRTSAHRIDHPPSHRGRAPALPSRGSRPARYRVRLVPDQ